MSLHIGLITLTDMDTAFDLGDVLSKEGHQISFYFSQHSLIRNGETPQEYREILARRGVTPPNSKVNLFELPRMRDPRSLSTFLEIRKTILNDKVDVLHILAGPSEPWLAILAVLVRKIPVISTLIVPEANFGDHLGRYTKPINRILIAGSDMLLVNCCNMVGSVGEEYQINPDRIRYVPLGARTTSEKWLDSHEKEEKAVLFFGRSDPHKGLEYLIEAQPRINELVPEAKIIIASHGENLQICKNKIEDFGPYEIHEGYIVPEKMAALFSRCSLVALPYLSASTSGVLLTAYQFGKPVVVTNVGCLSEYVEQNKTGILIPPHNPQALADSIVYLLKNDSLRKEMGSNARKWLDDHQSATTPKMISLYREMIDAHHKHAVQANGHFRKPNED